MRKVKHDIQIVKSYYLTLYTIKNSLLICETLDVNIIILQFLIIKQLLIQNINLIDKTLTLVQNEYLNCYDVTEPKGIATVKPKKRNTEGLRRVVLRGFRGIQGGQKGEIEIPLAHIGPAERTKIIHLSKSKTQAWEK